VEVATELTITPMEDLVEPPDLECNAIVPLPHSIDSTTDTSASAVDVILIMKEINFLYTNLIIILL